MSENEPPAPAEPKPVLARAKPQTKPKAKQATKKRQDSHLGRPVGAITYIIQGLKEGKFRGAQLQWAIERVEAYEQQKAQSKNNSLPGFPRDASPALQAYWLKQFGGSAARHRPQPEPKSVPAPAEPSMSVRPIEFKPKPAAPEEAPPTKAEQEAKRIQAEQEQARRLAEAVKHSAFLSVEDFQRYLKYKSEGGSIAFRRPDMVLVDRDNQVYSLDPYICQIAPSVRVKCPPVGDVCLREDAANLLQWVVKRKPVAEPQKPSKPKPLNLAAAVLEIQKATSKVPDYTVFRTGHYDPSIRGQ